MTRYTRINETLVQADLNGSEELYAKKGSMLAYTGDVQFQGAFLAGGSIQTAAMRQVTNEGLQLMKAHGRGSVLYGYHGLLVNIIPLGGERLYVESDYVLAFDHQIRAGTEFLGNQGGVGGMVRGAMAGQGLFTTTLDGYGDVVILSSGDLIELQVDASRPVFVDPQAYVGHKGHLTTQIHTDVSWKTFVGQSSGESFQFKFTGQGTVYVQADER
ncbi:AIM24 family protein [Deinococcus cellulosilyticus]|uniref:AIM24 family protein n=1 Tax=Deinococcus cellulosilyticus (strain DSM 18568 / NBRC 106333 / KACC 11606 / 5516J-15) TaxID=1223518 RepID=A0A511N6U0_DEIC1|nr:AIM24 family protein [Deinococcus cellulosilyticus]GEM48197.1 hypothetical protein DC3_38320 [Deinococcus cellulosilyticus NBRC 106333 = KACC 11606]